MKLKKTLVKRDSEVPHTDEPTNRRLESKTFLIFFYKLMHILSAVSMSIFTVSSCLQTRRALTNYLFCSDGGLLFSYLFQPVCKYFSSPNSIEAPSCIILVKTHYFSIKVSVKRILQSLINAVQTTPVLSFEESHKAFPGK